MNYLDFHMEDIDMATSMVIGTQWGDEGKGKIVGWIAERADVVVRSQGGNNAGIDSIWFNPNGLVNETPAVPTYQVKSYEEILKILSK